MPRVLINLFKFEIIAEILDGGGVIQGARIIFRKVYCNVVLMGTAVWHDSLYPDSLLYYLYGISSCICSKIIASLFQTFLELLFFNAIRRN